MYEDEGRGQEHGQEFGREYGQERCEGSVQEAPSAAEPSRPQSVREMTARELGAKGEEMAASYLDRKGWDVIARNWRCPFGEADIVARHHDDPGTVVLVEVKTRLALGESADEMPELAVNAQKRRRYRNIAMCYVVDHPDVDTIRFDVIALNVIGDGAARLRHLTAAFECDD